MTDRDDVAELLEESLRVITDSNAGRPLRCMCGCGLTFIGPFSAAEYFAHVHPSSRRRT